MEDGGFTLAVSNRKGRRRHIFRQSIGPLAKPLHNPTGANAEAATNRDGERSDEIDAQQIKATLTALRKRFPQEYIKSTINIVSGLLDGRRLVRIRILGIGSFENFLPSAFQLILVEEICAHFSVQDISSQDPIATPAEMKYLQSRGIKTPPADIFPSNSPKDGKNDEGGGVTLYYMIHCEHFMYENVLRSNWRQKSLRNLLFIGNDFRNYSDGNFLRATPNNGFRDGTTTNNRRRHRRTLNGSTNESEGGEGRRAELAALSAFASVCRQVKVEIPLEPHVFSDTFVVYFDDGVLLPDFE